MPVFLFILRLINLKPYSLAIFQQNGQRGRKNKNMEEVRECGTPGCPDCEKRAQEQKAADEMGLAFLVALMPLMTITLFSNMGLF